VVISAGIGCGPARDVVVSVGAGVSGGGPTDPNDPVVITVIGLLVVGLGAKENTGLNANAVEDVGCGEGKELPLGVAILTVVTVGAADTEKLKLLPPPPAAESKLGVLVGGADSCNCGCWAVLFERCWSCSG